MIGIFEELTEFAVNTTKILLSPVEVALHIINKPIKDISQETESIIDEIKY